MMKMTNLLKAGLAAAVLAGSVLAVQAADSFKGRYSWKMKGEYAQFYVAKEQGLFAKYDLDVALGEGGGSQAALGALMQGQEDVVIMPAVFALTAISQGMPVKVIALYHPKAPLGILSFQQTPVRTPKDLEGKSIAVSVGDTVAAYLPVLCKVNNVDCDKVKRVMMDHQVRTTQFMTRQVDMLGTYLNVDLPVLETKSNELVSMDLADHGVTVPGLSIVSSNELIEKKPEVLSRFLKAVGEAITMAKADPGKATDDLLKTWTVSPDKKIVQRQVEETLERIPDSGGKPVGWVDEELLQETLELLKSVGEISEIKPVDTYYTNALLEN